jgi:hypothetical protein
MEAEEHESAKKAKAQVRKVLANALARS